MYLFIYANIYIYIYIYMYIFLFIFICTFILGEPRLHSQMLHVYEILSPNLAGRRSKPGRNEIQGSRVYVGFRVWGFGLAICRVGDPN